MIIDRSLNTEFSVYKILFPIGCIVILCEVAMFEVGTQYAAGSWCCSMAIIKLFRALSIQAGSKPLVVRPLNVTLQVSHPNFFLPLLFVQRGKLVDLYN